MLVRGPVLAAWLVLGPAALGCSGTSAPDPGRGSGKDGSRVLVQVSPAEPAGTAQGASSALPDRVVRAEGPEAADLGPRLVALWAGPPSTQAFDAVPAASEIAPLDAARGAACPVLAVSNEDVLAWTRRNCRERTTEDFDDGGRRSGESRYDCGIAKPAGREVAFVGLHTTLGPLARGLSLRTYERAEYAVDGDGELLGKALSSRGPNGDERFSVVREARGWVWTGAPRARAAAPPSPRTLPSVRARLGNGALAEAAHLASAAARPGSCYRKIDFAVSEGVDWEVAVIVRGVGSRTSHGVAVPVLRLSGLVLPNRIAFETLVDAGGQELITRWTGGAGPDLWTRCPVSVLLGP